MPQHTDLAFLGIIPDIPKYYANVRGVSFIIDLIILCFAFAELMKFAGEKAKLPKRLGGILGFIFGAALTFAIHGAGYTLLQHWLVGVTLALVLGTAAFKYVKPYWGTWASLIFALFVGITILGLTRVALGETMRGILSLIIMIATIMGIIALFMGLLGKRAPGAPAGSTPPAPVPPIPPDLKPITDAFTALQQDMDARFAAQSASLGRIEQAVTDITGILRNVLLKIKDFENFLRSWQNWFSQIEQRFDDVKNAVTVNKKLVESHINTMTAWRADADKFRDAVTRTLAELKTRLVDGGNRLAAALAELAELKKQEKFLSDRAEAFNTGLQKIHERIDKLPEDLAKPLLAERTKLEALFKEVIIDRIKALDGVMERADKMIEMLKKWSAPELRSITERITQTQNDLIVRMAEFDTRLNELIELGKREPTKTDQINELISAVQEQSRQIEAMTQQAVTVLEELKDFEPTLAQLLQSVLALKEIKTLKVNFGTVVQYLKKILDKLVAAERENAQRALPPAELVVDLSDIDRAIDDQYDLLQDVMKKVKKLMEKLTLAFDFNARADEATWKAQAQEAIDEAKKDVGEIKLEEAQITAVQNALHKDREQLQAHRTAGPLPPDEHQRVAKLEQRLAGFEQFETDLMNFFRNIDQSLVQQVVVAISERVEERRKAGQRPAKVSGGYVLSRLDEYVKKLAQAIEATLTIKRAVEAERARPVRKVPAKKAAKLKPRKAR